MRRMDSLENILMLGKIEGRRRGLQRMRWLDGTTRLDGHEFEQVPGAGDDREAWRAAVHGVAELDMTERLN